MEMTVFNHLRGAISAIKQSSEIAVTNRKVTATMTGRGKARVSRKSIVFSERRVDLPEGAKLMFAAPGDRPRLAVMEILLHNVERDDVEEDVVGPVRAKVPYASEWKRDNIPTSLISPLLQIAANVGLLDPECVGSGFGLAGAAVSIPLLAGWYNDPTQNLPSRVLFLQGEDYGPLEISAAGFLSPEPVAEQGHLSLFAIKQEPPPHILPALHRGEWWLTWFLNHLCRLQDSGDPPEQYQNHVTPFGVMWKGETRFAVFLPPTGNIDFALFSPDHDQLFVPASEEDAPFGWICTHPIPRRQVD